MPLINLRQAVTSPFEALLIHVVHADEDQINIDELAVTIDSNEEACNKTGRSDGQFNRKD